MHRQQKQRHWIPCPAHLNKSFHSNKTVLILTALLCVQEALVCKTKNTCAVPVVSKHFVREVSVKRWFMVKMQIWSIPLIAWETTVQQLQLQQKLYKFAHAFIVLLKVVENKCTLLSAFATDLEKHNEVHSGASIFKQCLKGCDPRDKLWCHQKLDRKEIKAVNLLSACILTRNVWRRGQRWEPWSFSSETESAGQQGFCSHATSITFSDRIIPFLPGTALKWLFIVYLSCSPPKWRINCCLTLRGKQEHLV